MNSCEGLDEILRDVDVVFIRIEGLGDALLEVTCPIGLCQIGKLLFHVTFLIS